MVTPLVIINNYLLTYYSYWKGINRNHRKQTWHMLHDKLLSAFKHCSRDSVWKAHTSRQVFLSHLWRWECYNPAGLIFEEWQKEPPQSISKLFTSKEHTTFGSLTVITVKKRAKNQIWLLQRHCHLNLELVLIYLKRLFPESKITANYVCQALHKSKLKDVFSLSLIWWQQTLSLHDVSFLG